MCACAAFWAGIPGLPTSLQYRRLGKSKKWEGGMNVGIRTPDTPVFLASLFIAMLALLSFIYDIPYITPSAHWIALFAWVVLALGCILNIKNRLA